MGEKENNNNQNESLVTRWLRNAVFGATMADQPAMMTASGWRQNEKGDYVQDQQNDPHVKQLRDNLAAEGAGVMGEMIGIPLVYGISKYIPTISKIITGPDGKIFNSKIKYNPDNYYRGVERDAIIDAQKHGVIRGSNPSVLKGEGSGPWFGRGAPGFEWRSYIIEGTPESAEWIDALKYQKNYIEKLPKKNPNYVSGASIYDSKLEYGKEGFPMTNGDINATPSSNFIYNKRYPLFGWREKQF